MAARRCCAVLAAVVAVSACTNSHPSTAPSATAQPAPTAASSTASTVATQPETLDGAVAAAQEKSDRHSAGDFAGEWLMFTKDLRDNISQQTFVDYSAACSPTGLKIKVTGGRMDGADRAIVRQELLGVIQPASMAYEDGAWYKVPDEFLTSNYGKTAADLIVVDKAQGHCSNQ